MNIEVFNQTDEELEDELRDLYNLLNNICVMKS